MKPHASVPVSLLSLDPLDPVAISVEPAAVTAVAKNFFCYITEYFGN